MQKNKAAPICGSTGLATRSTGELCQLSRTQWLRGDNWFAWKTRMHLLLGDHRALKVVLGRVAKPDDPEGAAAWAADDKFARLSILLNVEDDQVPHVAGCATSAEMWANLRAVHELRMPRSVVAMKRRLYSMQAQEGTNVRAHVLEMKRLRKRLAWLGSTFEDEEFRCLVAMSLPRNQLSFWDDIDGVLLTGAGAE